MFKYVSDVSELSQNIIDKFVENKNVAIDCTLGNGYDTKFLSSKFNKVYSFDIQDVAIENYQKNSDERVTLIKDCHSKISDYVEENVDAVMYNLGFLPGGDKSITTNCESSLKSIECALQILNPGGIMTVAIYVGHEQGAKEEGVLMEYFMKLDKKKYGVMLHKVVNRSEAAPRLVVIEKK